MGDALGLRGRDRDRNEVPRRGAVMLPNFIMIGAAKAGTTALYWYLAEPPQVFMSPMKETNYFAYGLDEQGHLLYGDIPSPDLFVHLTAPLDVTLARNAARDKTEPEDYVRFRHSLSSNLEFDGVPVHRISTDRSLEDVVREVKEAIWETL